MKMLLENGAEVGASTKVGEQTPLLVAARIGHEGVVKVLLENGAEVETRLKDGRWTSLHVAAGNGQPAMGTRE